MFQFENDKIYRMPAHIIKALAELPMLELFPVMLTKGKVFLMSPTARVLE